MKKVFNKYMYAYSLIHSHVEPNITVTSCTPSPEAYIFYAVFLISCYVLQIYEVLELPIEDIDTFMILFFEN